MGKRLKQTFHQRRCTDGQQTQEKILNITNYYQSANENCDEKRNCDEVSPHTSQHGHHQKNLQTINAGEGVKKREPSYSVGGNVNWYSHYGEQYGNSLKNQKQSYPLIQQSRSWAYIHRKTWSKRIHAPQCSLQQFTIAKA